MSLAEFPDRVRLWVHALDRTGPAMLTRATLLALSTRCPDTELEVLALRGGPLERDISALARLHVVLEDREPWSAVSPDPVRLEELAERHLGLEPAVNVLVSVAAGQALAIVGESAGPVVTWVVEVGEDLHWVTDGVGLRRRTVRWLAGSEASRSEVEAIRGIGPVDVVPEFVEPPTDVASESVAEARALIGAGADTPVVLGVGIGTRRKGIDLFLEAAALLARRQPGTRCVWVGGEGDPLWGPVACEAETRTDNLSVLASVEDLTPWLAAADVLLHPARRDAFPLVALHAAAQGLPVVAFSGVGGMGEMLGDSFVSADYPDLVALVGKVSDLLADRDRRTRLGAAQRAQVMARHVIPDAVDPLLAVISDAHLGRHR